MLPCTTEPKQQLYFSDPLMQNTKTLLKDLSFLLAQFFAGCTAK